MVLQTLLQGGKWAKRKLKFTLALSAFALRLFYFLDFWDKQIQMF